MYSPHVLHLQATREALLMTPQSQDSFTEARKSLVVRGRPGLTANTTKNLQQQPWITGKKTLSTYQVRATVGLHNMVKTKNHIATILLEFKYNLNHFCIMIFIFSCWGLVPNKLSFIGRTRFDSQGCSTALYTGHIAVLIIFQFILKPFTGAFTS